MKNITQLYIVVLLVVLISCTKKQEPLINSSDLAPWCILGFDSLNRTPEQRIKMLKEMEIKKYGFNRGKGNFDEMKKEFKLAKVNDIEITSVFLWLNAERDSIGKLSQSNQVLLDNLFEVDQKPTIWVSFSNNFYVDLNQEQSIEFSVEMIKYIKLKAEEIGCKLALYNHHGWFGNPYNQLKILEEFKQDSISMVYNFHHVHEYIDDFPKIVQDIKPYLSYVNLNGVKKNGPQILTIGKGDFEYDMIKLLRKEGYNGPWGILGHIKNKDVQKVLKQNIEGIELLNSKHYSENRQL